METVALLDVSLQNLKMMNKLFCFYLLFLGITLSAFSQQNTNGLWKVNSIDVTFSDKTRENLGVQTSLWRTIVKDDIQIKSDGLNLDGFKIDDKNWKIKYQLVDDKVFRLIFIDEVKGRESYIDYFYSLNGNLLNLKRADKEVSEEITFEIK